MTEHRLAPTFRLISSHLPTYGPGIWVGQVIATCSCGEKRPADGYGGWWAWHLAHALDEAATPNDPAEPLGRAADAATELAAATRSVYRAIWNSDYDTDLVEKGRTAAHQLAEELAGALAKDGLLAAPADDEAAIERMAYAMWQGDIFDPVRHQLDDWRDAARAALAALRGEQL